MGIFFNDDKKKRDVKSVDDKKIQLKKEELDIIKNKIKIGDVEIGKEIVSEVKDIGVPITHEEVVIERRSLDNEPTSDRIIEEEKYTIPVMDEVVDVDKHTVIIGEVSAHKHEIEDERHIKETLRKEEARIHTDGDANIVNDEVDRH